MTFAPRAAPSSYLALCLLVASPAYAAEVGAVLSPAQQEAERLRALRQALAQPVDLFCPFFSVRSDASTDLFLLNTTADPLAVDLFALTRGGSELPLGRYAIDGSQHLFLSLRQLLAGSAVEEGSIRLSLLGDADSLAAWAVVGSGRQAFEIPFSSPTQATSTTLLSFWDSALAGGRGQPPEVELRLLSTVDHPVFFSLTFANGTQRPRVVRGTLAPGATERVVVPADLRTRGWVRLEHDGDPGSVLALGLFQRAEYLGRLDFVSAAKKSAHFEAIRLPQERGRATVVSFLSVSLFNASEREVEVTVELLDQQSGRVLSGESLVLEPWQVAAEAIRAGHGAAEPEPTDDARLRIRASGPALLVRGAAALAGGEVVDLAFFSAEEVHSGGTYPLPDPQRYDVSTLVVNLGGEASTLVAQLFWAGGTYAVGPVVVPAGGAHEFVVSDLVLHGKPDLLGRRADPLHPQGVLKWTVQRGGHELIGRTLVRSRSAGDTVGFNCFGCCWQIPSGVIVPEEVSFLPGELRPFEAAVMYNTCSGLLGPFGTWYVSQSVPYPFTWDGSTIGASDGADDTIEFEGIEEQIPVGSCTPTNKAIRGIGTAKTCQALHNPKGYDPKKTCVVQTQSCLECKECCDALKAQKRCQKKDPRVVESEHTLCVGHCETDMCN
jgi:hypothetical protein